MRNSTDGPIQDQAVMLAIRHRNWSAKQVHRELLRINGHDPNGDTPDGFPSLRTVQRALQRLDAEASPGDEWTMLDGTAADARVVLEHLVDFLLMLQPGRRPTRGEAELLARIVHVAPELDSTHACWLAVWGARNASCLRNVEDYLAQRGTHQPDNWWRRLVEAGLIDPQVYALQWPTLADPESVESPGDVDAAFDEAIAAHEAALAEEAREEEQW